MYIEPGTNIRILKNVPLDNTYEHTIYFDSVDNQTAYFIAKQKYNLTNYTYQRVKRGFMRVGIKAENLYDCNYVMWQNTSFGTKWFYAFIKSVEYINNECSEIEFEIDVMQTWFFDFAINQCFVEREHVTEDRIGQHIEPEHLECGEYVFNDYGTIIDLSNMAVVILVSDTSNAPDGTLYEGIYGGSTLFAYNNTDVDSIKAKLDEYVQKPDSIVGMYMCPVLAFGHAIPTGGIKVLFSKSGVTLNATGIPITVGTAIDGYIPKNNKLYTYPYNFFNVDNANGSSMKFRYEFFFNGTPDFRIACNITQPVKMILRPANYKGCGGNTLNTESIALSDYPMCSWSTDAFKAWLAQNSIPLVANSAVGAVTAIGGLLTGNPVLAYQGAGTVMGTITGAISAGYQASVGADISKGSVNNGSSNVSSGKQNFYGGRMSVTAEYARMIDDFFNMFGYAVKVCKKPNRNFRPHWNYVKTLGCNAEGSVPADDMRRICEIHDKGITYWRNGDEIGNYLLDNRIPSA